MIFVYILLIAAGALPLVVFLVKWKRYRKILREGSKTRAQISSIQTVRQTKGASYDRVCFIYQPTFATQYYAGQFSTKVGKHKRSDTFEVYYLPKEPQKHAVPGSKGELFMLVFTILLFLFVIYAAYQIHLMVKDQDITYSFKPPWK
ncbi:DUF3592 domain-containing protein [Pseudocnuella soli]|uniref:DUF3592 domain-containing protein n=1 Tax=Pseudocnuella soli TaxID=2502779 RepID=UPI001051CE72|nr:DUF3592 domain-containing protein [Pseudocnuella soli]